MELDATPPVDERIAEVLRAALAQERSAAPVESAWQRAALAEGVERDGGYELSPRSTRGATRA